MKANAKEALKKYLWNYKQVISKHIKTSGIYKWGAENYSNRAVRNAQDLASKGQVLRRLTKWEATMAGFDCSEGVYEII